MKRSKILLMTILILFVLVSGCATTTEPPLCADTVPLGYTVIEERLLTDLMTELFLTKQALQECLERER